MAFRNHRNKIKRYRAAGKMFGQAFNPRGTGPEPMGAAQEYLFDPGDDQPETVWLTIQGPDGLDFSGRVPRWVRNGVRHASHGRRRHALSYIRTRLEEATE